MMPFFSDFERKNHHSYVYILSKNRKISKKSAVFMPMFCRLFQKHALPMSFFQIFHENSIPFMSIFGQKNVNRLYYRPQNSIRQFFVRIYTKNTALMPIFYQKTSILKKHIVLTPIFCKKNVHSLKNTVFSRHYSKFS